MIVDHVEDHGEPVPVRGIDQRAQIVGAAIAARRREQAPHRHKASARS